MTRTDDTGKLILRLALGIMILLHGIAKISTGVSGVGGMLASHGLPSALAYLVYVGEIVAPVLVIIGFYTRPAAWIIAINMVVAIWLVHMKDLLVLGKNGGWALELQGMFLFAAIAVALLGAGRLSVGGSSGKYN
ncbi:DoxX family protein [Variovorax sp. LT1P1]|uniref:DoxX family protein n=1 Tax=Variovorax sp. LT1P1 TaxID=3443730 RepID=UPI003F47ABBD